MELSLSEEAYSRELYRAYKTYGSNIPDSEWEKIDELRAKYGIGLSRVREIINAVQEGTIAPSIEQAQPISDKTVSSASISTDVACNMKHHVIENSVVASDMERHDNHDNKDYVIAASDIKRHDNKDYVVAVSDMKRHDNGNRNISNTSGSNEIYQDYIPVPINNLSVKEDDEDDEVRNYEDTPTKELQYLAEECDGWACLELSKRYAHGTVLLERDKDQSKELRRLGMLYLYGSTISPEFEDSKASYKSVFFDENGKPYIDWQAKSQQMKKLLKDLGTLTRRYNKLASNFDIIQRKLSDLTRPEEVKKAPKYFGTWLNISLLIGLVLIIITHFIGLGVLIMLIAPRWYFIRKKKKAYSKYSWGLYYYKKDKSEQTIEYAKEKRKVDSAIADVKDALYDGLNVGLGIPFNKDIISRDTYAVFVEGLKKLFELNDKAMCEDDPARRRIAEKRYYDAKLRFFYTYSLRAETELDEVYNHYQEIIHKSVSTGNADLLRKSDFPYIIQNDAKMAQDLSDIKGLLDEDRLAYVMEKLGYVQSKDISSFGGIWTNEDKLVEKSNELKELYDIAKDEYEELTDSNEKLNYWLDYVRAYAYRNTYLGVELINIVRSNAGGRTLATQKDGIDVSILSYDVPSVTINDAAVDLDAHINNTINSFTKALMNKQSRKWMKSNPKFTMGAAALTFVGGALMDKLDKHTQLVSEHNEFQQTIISNLKQMVEGYEEGKFSSLRAIEIIKAIAKANKGFMAVYEPLRKKYLERGESLSMLDLQAIAKATQDYKNISDSSLR